MKRLVLLGGGHAHCAVLAYFARQRGESDVELVLVSPWQHAVYSGMVPGWMAGDYRFEECRIDLALQAKRAGARHIVDRAMAVQAGARRVVLEDGGSLDYDLLSLNVGSVAALAGLEGAEQGIALRPIESMQGALEQLDARARSGELRRLVVVGGGAAGVEVLLALNHRLSMVAPDRFKAALVADTRELLPDHGRHPREMVRKLIEQRGMELFLGAAVRSLSPRGLELDNGKSIAADAVILATGAAPHPWLTASDLAGDGHGFVAVDACLRSTSHVEVFGAGDAVTTISSPRPKSGVFAVRQGAVLARNLSLVLQGRKPLPFESSSQALAIFNTGGKCAIAAWHGIGAQGRWVWRWKDWLDRRFMARYR